MKMLMAVFAAFVLATAARAEIDIKEVTSPGGLKAWLVEDHAIPFVALELRFQGGASLDLPGKRGATYVMTGMLEEGSGDMDSRAFSRELEGLAASFSYDAGDDYVSISARFLTDTQDEAVALLRQSILEPSFDPAALDRVRAQLVSGISSDLKDPDTIAQHAFEREAFGNHPYAMPIEGTLESVQTLTQEDLQTAHQNALARDRIYISAVGDITAAELGDLLDTLLEGLPDNGAPFPADAPFNLSPGVTVVPFATPQSVAIFGHEGIERDHPDFLAAFVVNAIFGGGGFEARLMNEVREKRGLTYGIYSYLAPKDYADLYVGRFSSANDRIAEAIEVIREEWQRMASEGVSQEELDEIKTYLTGAYPLRFDGNGRIANILVGMQIDDFPLDYVVKRNDLINALTLEDVNRVASELYQPERLSFIVVGQPEGLGSQISQ